MQGKTKAISKIVQIYQGLAPQSFQFQVLPRIDLLHHQWSSEMIEEDIVKCKEIVQSVVKAAKSETDLLRKIMPLTNDYLFLKAGILSIHSQIKLYCKNLRKDDLYESFKNMSFSEFIILILKMNQQKDILGLLLSSVRVPLPIYLKVGKKAVNMIDVLKGIMGINKLSLIFNCGTDKARKCGKTTFLYELFSLPKDYQYKESPFYEASVYIHKTFPGSRNNLLADFNGSFQNMSVEVSLLHKNSGLLMLHILEEELYQEDEFIADDYFLKFQNILNSPEKIIILIRNCTKETKPEDVLASLGNLEKKCLVFCLSQEVEMEVYEQIAEQLKKKKIFELKKTFNYFDILNDPQKTQNIQSYYKDSQKIINMLPSLDPSIVETNENLTKVLFPHLFISNQISILSSNLLEKQLQYQFVTEEKKDEAYKIIKRKEIQIGRLKDKLKTGSEISNFVKKGFEILTNGIREPEKIQVFNTMLYLWKKEMVKPQLFEYIKISKEINDLSPAERQKKEFLMKQAEKIQEKLDMYDISTTTILNDVITKLSEKDETNESQQEKQSRKLSLATIQTSYSISYKSMYPINLVDGKNLIFGNKYLKEYCRNLSLDKRFANKKVYIISVVGVQSSGKSTLLNYLFRCQFETSAGRCTKGMYFNICQFEDKIIWLIDTEGLASLNARDPLFDNKIATFVLSISNIVIINNKGELNNQLRDMLEICTFAMKHLRKEDKVGNFKPQKLIFALRDQAMPKNDQKFQEQMVSKIMTQFEKSKERLNLDFKQYLDLQPDDIISFPSIFNEAEVKFKTLGTIESYSETFGRCIVGLRSRIMSILDKEQGRNSIFDCYSQAQVCWQTILKCGSDLMNFKTLGELAEKQFILNSYLRFYANYNKQLKEQFKALFQTLTKDANSKSLELMEEKIKRFLIQKKEEMFQKFKKQLRSHCAAVCAKDQWYEVCYDKILILCLDYQNIYMDQLAKLRMTLKQDESLDQFAKKVDAEVKQLLLKNTEQEKMRQSLNKMKEEILREHDKEQKKFKDTQMLFEMQIASALQRGFKQEKVSTIGAKWVSQYKELSESTEQKKYAKIYQNSIFEKVKQVFQIKPSVKKIHLHYFEKLFKKIEQSCKNNKNIWNMAVIKDIQYMAVDLQQNLKLIHSQIQQQLNLERPKKDIVLLKYNNRELRDVLRGCLICNIAQILKTKGKMAIQQKRTNCLQQIEKCFKKVTDAFKNKDNIKQNSLAWIKQVVEFYQQLFKKSCKQKLSQELDLLKTQINPELLIDHAFQESFLRPVPDKTKWIECFKMISNTNKYLFEILCKQPLIATRKALTSNVLTIQKQKIKSLFQSQFIVLLKAIKAGQKTQTEQKTQQKIIKTKQQIEAELIQRIKSKYRLLQNSNFTDKDILILMKTCLDDPAFYKLQTDLIETSVTTTELNIELQGYINTTVKDNIVGCPSACPFCGVKCNQRKAHKGGHEVKYSCHVMSCFKGRTMVSDSSPSYSMCATKNHLTDYTFRNGQDDQLRPALAYLLLHHSDWHEYFKKMIETNSYRSSLQEARYYQIWANVRKMLIKHMYRKMVDNNKFQSLESDPLNDEDLINCKFINLEGNAVSLLDYVTR